MNSSNITLCCAKSNADESELVFAGYDNDIAADELNRRIQKGLFGTNGEEAYETGLKKCICI